MESDMELDTEQIVKTALELAQKHIPTQPLISEIILKQLLRAIPDYPDGLALLGIVRQKMEQWEDSITIFEKAIEVQPNSPDCYNNMGRSYAMLNNYDKSIECMNKALELRPNHHYYISNLALQYRAIGNFDQAIELFKRAIEIENSADLWTNLGGVYAECHRMDESIDCLKKATEINEFFTAAHVDLAYSYHLTKQWEKGFIEYEWRLDHFHQFNYYRLIYDMDKRWKGESLVGKTILLFGEQGLGDMIQFSRYAKQLKERGASKVIIHCADILTSIMERVSGIDEVVNKDIDSSQEGFTITMTDSDLPYYDYQCCTMSLPYLLKDFHVSGKPYLKPKATLNSKSPQSYPDTLNIGIAWAGSPAHPNDMFRSVHLKHFEGLSKIPGVRLFNLQVNKGKRAYNNGTTTVDFTEGGSGVRMVDMTTMIQNFEDSATVITGLDLVITVDTALVHLAGALGVPCWALISYNPDWRWGLEGDKTEWYDSVTLYRQPKRADWESVFEKVEADVKSLLPNQ